MSYQVNLESWSEIAGTRIKNMTQVEVVQDDKSPEVVVYEKVLDLSEQSIKAAIEAMGWTSPDTAKQASATMQTAMQTIDLVTLVSERRRELLRKALACVPVMNPLHQAIYDEVTETPTR
jgi:L-fucose mutarotase/ribose pyranase (RbsD/FucU family)